MMKARGGLGARFVTLGTLFALGAGLATIRVEAQGGAPGPASASPSAQVPAAASPSSQISGSSLETTVVGMVLLGLKKHDRLVIQDLDILLQADGDRLLPLLRILRVMRVDVQRSGSVLTFVPEGSAPTALDLDRKLVDIGGSAREVEIVSGISDVTGEPELYLAERDVSEILGVAIEWKPELYEYTFRTNRPLKLFERRFDRSRSIAAGDGFESYALPGNLPPAQAGRSIAPKLLFAKVQLRTSAIRRSGEARPTATLSPPRAAAWAQVLGGNVAARASQKTESPRDGYKLDALSWNTVFDETAVSLGSGNLGLSELVFPSLSLVGATVNGNVGPGSILERDPSMLGKQQRFAPLHVFEGFAPLGSEVSLFVNGKAVESQKVEPIPGAPPGEGAYRFEGLNLFTSRLNDVRIVSTAPDGTVEESRRRVLGTDLLIPSGRLAFVGGAGGKRRFSADDLSSGGSFGGARLHYGLGRRFSLGASGAFQRDLFLEEQGSSLDGDLLHQPPSHSLHFGTRVIWQPLDPLLLLVEAARSGWYADSSTGAALRADGEYHLGAFQLHSGVFRYEPRFFDGRNWELNDVEGARLGASLRYGKGQQLGVAGSRMQDNLDGTRSATIRLSDAQASWSFRLVRGASLILAGKQTWIDGGSRYRSYLLGLDSGLPWRWQLRGRYEFGDDIRGKLRTELPDGSSAKFDLPSQTTTGLDGPGLAASTGALNSIVELRRRMAGSWQINLAHRSAGTFDRTTLDLVRSTLAQGRWQARISPGYDWSTESPFFQNRLEFFLDRSRRNRIGLETQLVDREWAARISLEAQLDFGFSGLAPVPLFDTRLEPDAGGVRGRVFLDQNGNGLLDRGEPGLEGIDVMSDRGRKAVSGNGGLFILSNSSNLRRAQVSLAPASLSAIYTPTQGRQEVFMRPGVFTEVNLGVAVLGTITGVVLGVPATPDSIRAAEGAGPALGDTARVAPPKGVSGVRILLVDGNGSVAGTSITGRDGVYTIVDVKPGRYTIRPDEVSLPEGFRLDVGETSVEILSKKDPVELKAADFKGHYTTPRPKVEEDVKKDVQYKVFD